MMDGDHDSLPSISASYAIAFEVPMIRFMSEIQGEGGRKKQETDCTMLHTFVPVSEHQPASKFLRETS